MKKIPVGLMLDTGGCGLITGQMIGRWGNFFNREAFGEYTDGLFAMRLPLDAVRSGDVTEKMREHMETIDGVSCIQVSPTFLYESVWCLLVLILLLVYTRHKKFNGEVFFDLSCRIWGGKVLDRIPQDRSASAPGDCDPGVPAAGRCAGHRIGVVDHLGKKETKT